MHNTNRLDKPTAWERGPFSLRHPKKPDFASSISETSSQQRAEELYRKALSIAQEQDARLWELRAAVSLARLRCDQGRRAEAHDLLAPVYSWFTEGFDTPDLKEAKALLDELR